VIYFVRLATGGREEDSVKPTWITATIAAAAVLTMASCGGVEEAAPPTLEASVSNHETVTVDWEDDLPSALERARSEGKPVLINFYADWCVWCKRLESTTFRDAKVATMLRDRVIPLSLNVEGNGRKLSNEYRVDGLPTILVLDPDGREIGRIPGYAPPRGFLERVDGLLQQS
jgi:thiol:disulfide interchange protein